MEIVIGLVILFIIQWVLCYGLLFAKLRRNWPSLAEDWKSRDKSVSLVCGFGLALIPVVGPIVAFGMAGWGKHGLLFK